MKMYEQPQRVDKYLNIKLECDCGHVHYAPIKSCKIGPGAINSIADYVRDFGYHRPYILCDKITYEIAGKKCESLLREIGCDVTLLIIRHMGFDEATLGEIVINKPDDCDLMIGCGTGSITDMLRYASYKLGLPCFTVATGAPMDGFSASVGIMNVDNLKATMPAHSTEVIIGDTDILATAPYRMSIAGYADLIGKLTALNDWRIAVLANGEHYCRHLDTLVTDYVEKIMAMTDRIRRRDPEALGEVFNALLLTGAVISLYGNSRPISGSEHHMSHYWEALGDQQGKAYAMHGEQVAVGTVLSLMMSEALYRREVDFDAARAKARAYDRAAWEAEIHRVYGAAAEAIIRLEDEADKNGCDRKLKRIDAIEKNWHEIRELLRKAYPAEKLRAELKELGCPADPKEIGIAAPLLRDTFLYCKETRDRYTVYQLLWDLGLMEEVADQVIEELQTNGAV